MKKDPFIFSNNIKALKKNHPLLAISLEAIVSNCFYSSSVPSKEGSMVPLYHNGSAAHSLYNPLIEASRIVSTIEEDTCVLFCGIGAGYHIRQWIESSPFRPCILLEADLPSLRSLLDICDVSDILQNNFLRIITAIEEDAISSVILETWKPALEKSFKVVTLRSWENLHQNVLIHISKAVSLALKSISTDYSVQSHFGRLWMRNALRNLSLAEKHQGKLPTVDSSKIALIIAAGPSLEDSICSLIENRNIYTVFATDTSYGILIQKGVIPDFFISIDAQHISISHIMTPLEECMTIILDATAHPGIAIKAIERGCNVVFCCGGHPLLAYALKTSPLPFILTDSGTVTGTALGVAQSLGFSKIEFLGADFQYTAGKAYARGSYLDVLSFSQSNRMNPPESFWTTLIFRAPVHKINKNGLISYTTDTLEYYAKEITKTSNSILWTKEDFVLFPFQQFIAHIQNEYVTFQSPYARNQESFYSFLPFLAWYNHSQRNKNSTCSVQCAINLALELIAGYTNLL